MKSPTTAERRARRWKELSPDVRLGKAYDRRVLARLWAFVRPHRGLFTLAMLSYPLASALHLLQPYIIKVAIDEHLVPRKVEGFELIALAFVGVVALELGARFYQTVLTQLLGQRVTKDLRVALFHKLQVVDVGFLERNPVGRLMTRVTNDVESISEAFTAGAVSILGDLVTLFGIIVMMLALDVRLTLYAFAVLPVMVGIVLFFRRPAREAFREVRTRLAQLNGFLNEALSGMSLVQAFRQERHMQEEFGEVNLAYRDANFDAIRYDAMIYAIVEGVSTIATALILVFGAALFFSGKAEIGLFVAFVDYLRRFFAPITELSTKYTVIQQAMASSERCIDLLDEPVQVASPPSAAPATPFAQALCFEAVDFAYGADGPKVLERFELQVKRGEKVAIVGPTGAGKSTVVKLLARFFDPTGGRVTLDGRDLRELSFAELRGRMALVLQDAFLFDGTVEENVAFGAKDPRRPALEQAAERTQALGLIQRLPQGWESPVGERGANISVGERQLLAFARALARDPEILILDEATSSVDPETEARIQRGVEALIADRTAIIIAHRLSTIRSVDRIVVIAGGRVLEQGSHEELYARGGAYRNLYELQFAGQKVKPAA